MKIDDTDRRILRAWQKNPGAPISEISSEAGLSHTPCWRRMRKLKEGGVVIGQAILLDPAALDLSVSVFAQLRLKEHDEKTLIAFEKATRECPQIVESFSMSGDSDYLIRVVATSIADYESFLKKTLLHLPGVASVNSSFALKCIKLTTELPI
ncbi:MAG: AsnC family transcriptional regulator [Robiginitomaculum sp.]|nr:MAG: AsnC family transcriptional regulator [Robiginitomaculum sp.]